MRASTGMGGLPRFAIDLLRDVASTRLGAALVGEAFLTTARLAAWDFARVPGVVGVYLAGSWTRVGTAAPGYSDIDLLITVDVPTLADELGLRRRLHEVQARWNTLAVVLKHIDYVEHRDFETLVRGGEIYWIGAHDRLVSLAGRSDLVPGQARRRDSVQRIASALSRWTLFSQVLIDPTFVRAEVITRRTAERLLAAVIADALHMNPNEPPAALIEHGRQEIPELAGFQVPSSLSTSRFALTYAVAALRVVEHACASHSFEEPVSLSKPGGGVDSSSFDRSARAIGFQGGAVVALPPPRAAGMAFIFADEDPERAVARLHENWRRLESVVFGGSALRPILVTRRLWSAIRVLSPAPELGEALSGRATAWGVPPPLGDRDRATVAVGATLALFYRPRGRAFRVDRSNVYALRGLALDVHHVAPTIRAYRLGERLPAPVPLPERLIEADLLERLRGFIAEERPAIRALVGLSPDET